MSMRDEVEARGRSVYSMSALVWIGGLVLGQFLSCGFDTDADGDGFFSALELKGSYIYDCNDNDPAVRGGIPFYFDSDGDKLGDAGSVCFVCIGPNDDEPYSLTEVDGTEAGCEAGDYVLNDWDCDDEDDAAGLGLTYYRDQDEDGMGDPNTDLAIYRCPEGGQDEPPEGYVLNADDCNDDVPTEPDSNGRIYYYLDADGDGYGDPLFFFDTCGELEDLSGYVSNGDDCDDKAGAVNPDALYDCAGDEEYVDNDCDGSLDEDANTEWYEDKDEDGFGNQASVYRGCPPPDGYVRVSAGGPFDCDDDDKTVNPEAGNCGSGTGPTPTAASDEPTPIPASTPTPAPQKPGSEGGAGR